MDNPTKVKTLNIKTLDEILADVAEITSADTAYPLKDIPKHLQKNNPVSRTSLQNKTKKAPSQTRIISPITNHKKHLNDQPSAVGTLLQDTQQSVLDDNSLKILSQVSIEKLAIPDKATRYLRWLAFYYLSKKELSRHELRTKLLAKDCDPVAVDELLDEFTEKGYQSDERYATMVVREAVRKGRGVRHITQTLKKSGLDIKQFGGIDALIRLADASSIADGTILDDEHDKSDEIDWLKLAVEARCKKYGDSIPKDHKEKARQLRFLQYRGFATSVCFHALKMTLKDFDET